MVDDDGFLAFAEAVSPRLLRTAWLLCGDPAESEELVQSALVAVYRKWPRLSTGMPLTPAYRVIVNGTAHRARRHRREVATGGVTDPGRRGVEPADTRWLLAALATLPLRERQCVVLRHDADLPEAEIADVLGVGVGAVKSSTARGLHRLRALLVEGGSHAR